METRILLVRHGETDWNRQLRCQGHTDVPLNEAGRQQARDLAERLQSLPLAAVYSSDLQRALDTARTAAEPHHLPLMPLVELRERLMGQWEGLTVEDRRSRWPRQSLLWEQGERHVDGVDMEPFEDLTRRLVRVVGDAAARHPGQSILMVTHGGCVFALLDHLGTPWPERGPFLQNCAVTPLVVGPSGWRLDGDIFRRSQADDDRRGEAPAS